MYQLNPLNNIRLFDGNEAGLEQQSFRVNARDGKAVSFSFADFSGHPLHTLRQYLPDAEFETLIRDAGFRKGTGIIEQHVNRQNLELYYFVYTDEQTAKPFFALVSFGEISPGRYAVHFEGVLEWVEQERAGIKKTM